MKVINFFGGPGCGKSTTASWLFHQLKTYNGYGLRCEYVTEFAKDLTYEENYKALSCQEYVFGNQLWRMKRLKGKTDVVITDSPLLLSIFYDDRQLEPFENVVLTNFDDFENINIFLERPSEYKEDGRNESEYEAKEIDKNIIRYFMVNGMQIKCLNVEDENFKDDLLKYVISELRSR